MISGDSQAIYWVKPGNKNGAGRLSTADLLIKVACFEKKENNIFNIKTS